jgi:hypothetical protein
MMRSLLEVSTNGYFTHLRHRDADKTSKPNTKKEHQK